VEKVGGSPRRWISRQPLVGQSGEGIRRHSAAIKRARNEMKPKRLMKVNGGSDRQGVSISMVNVKAASGYQMF
jgi:hypothetical protein